MDKCADLIYLVNTELATGDGKLTPGCDRMFAFRRILESVDL